MLSKSLVVLALLSAVFSAPLTRRANASDLDFGSCSNPTIIFANGLDGRNEPSFEPANESSFNHGSALNIGIISSFICGQLQSACKANQAAIDACTSGEQAASSLTGQAAADAFNAAVTGGASTSSSTSSTPPPAASSPPSSTSDSSSNNSGDCVQTTVTVTAAAAAPTETQSSTSTPSTSSSSSDTSSSSTPSGQNLQTFTGNLGGLPPPVTAGGKGFEVDNSQFVNLAGALGRSCDVQHNICANAANSKQGNFTVADCDEQDTKCKAATA